MLFCGSPMISWLRDKRWRKDVQTQAEAWQVREDTPETHQKKQGTPSMGGIGIVCIACAMFVALLSILVGLRIAMHAGPAMNSAVFWVVIGLFLLPLTVAGHAGLGFADDWSKASGRGGLRARAKLFGQIALSLLFLTALVVLLKSGPVSTVEWQVLRWLTNWDFVPAILLFSFLLVVLVGTCNAVNLTDGIDGLAAGLAVQTGLCFWLLSFNLSDYVIGGPVVLFWAALAGSCLGFLAFNKYPAKVFMGDTGSLALGAAVGAGAIMCHAVFLLPFIAFIYFVEAGSVMLQVLYFKYTRRKFGEGRRIFRRAPLHHHFELGGWSEWRVVGTFWAINLITSAIGLILWHMGKIPHFP